MKKFTKLLFAVAALFALACTTDATKDLAVELGKVEGQTTLTLSLEESRTQLGEAVAGLYPVTWSEGDKISVNGVESSSIVISENAAVATFTFNETLSYPYAIAYPAAAAGKVVFADQQPQSEGTFANGAAAMYGYKSAEGGLALNHLTGVLKIGVVGTGAINFVQISTVDRAPIAGEFAIDFATGELTPTSASKYQISAAFEESADGDAGLALSSEPKYLHFTVPAGVYNELYVTLYDADGGVMYATVKADDTKPLVAGKVREFSTSIPYAPNASVFVIRDKETLKAFGEQAATLDKDALFVADVDMTGEAWTPIEGYAKTVLGNGYSIKGMTAPLFGTTSASVKGLHLEDVTLVTNDAIQYGALACKVTATDDIIPIIEHCSVSGTFTVKNTILNPTAAIEPMYGCLIGVANGAMLDACENRATMTVEQATASGNTIEFSFFCGDIIGALDRYVKSDKSVLYSGITNSKNYGALEYKDISNPAKHRLEIYLGGIAGVSRSTNTKVLIHNNENHGDITITSNFAGSYIGGINGYAKGAADYDGGSDCVNHGKITIKGGSRFGGRMYIGGVWGGPAEFTANRCHNYGAITFEEGEIIGGTLTLGGVCGRNSGGNTSTLNDCTNNAPILIAASCVKDTAISFQIGGIAGYSQSAVHNNINNKEGSITISGLFYTNGSRSTQASPKSGSHALGGICGYKTMATMNNNENHADIIWSGDVVELSTGDPGQIRIGGYQGYGSMDVNEAVCDGKIILSGTYGCEINTGGVLTFNYGNPGTITSNTDFEISGTFNGGLIVGGVISVAYNDIQNLTYNGTINISNDTVVKRLFTVGGCIGQAWGVNTSAKTCKGLTNNGTINVAGTAEVVSRIAGCVGAATATDPGVAHNVSDVTNNGPITVSSTVSGGNLYLAGCTGTVTRYMTGGINNATITFSGNHTSNNFYIAGVSADVGEDAKNGENYGDIICTADCYANSPRVSGVVGYVSDRVTDCINHGNLTYAGKAAALSMAGICYFGTANSCTNGVEGDDTKGQIIFTGSSTGNTHFGGIMRDSWNAHASNSTNYGDMHLSGHSGGSMYVGGCIYSGIAENYTCTNFNNYGDINVSSTIGSADNTGADFFIGGIAYVCGKGDKALSKGYINCHNYGNFNVTSACSVANSMRIGGLIANIEVDIPLTFDSCSNHGNITVEGTSSVHTSGSFMIAGCISNFDDNKQTIIKGGLKNTGNITLGGENKKSSVIAAGVFGSIASDAYTSAFEHCLANEGNINVSSKAATSIHVGGVVGNLNYTMAIPMYNIGDITVTGTSANPVDNRVGGLVSWSSKAFHGECFCNITAVGFEGVTGILTGSPRADVFAAANSKVGGTICTNVTTTTEEDSDGNTTTITTNNVITLDATNYFNYLYGTVVWTGAENYDGCTLLSSKEEIVYPTIVEPEPTPEEGTTPEA